MNPKTKNLLIRTVSGVLYVGALVVGTLYWPLMGLLLCAMGCVGHIEFFRMASGPTDKLSRALSIACTILLFGAFFYMDFGYGTYMIPPVLRYMLSIVIISSILMILSTSLGIIELFKRRPCPIEHIGTTLLSYCWITLPLACIYIMTLLNYAIVLAFLIFTWTFDTFAYLSGSLYGKTKMCEKISPKKTWEGTFSGIIAVIILALLFPTIPFFASLYLATWKWVVFGLLTAIFGIFGDLLESLFKRNAGIKDSGRLMPGHGGILDRIDSMLVSAIPALLFMFFQLF